MYLVMLTHDMDDLPVKLFDNETAAFDFANGLDGEPGEHIRKVFQTDCSTPNCVSVVEFAPTEKLISGCGYSPTKRTIVKSLNDIPLKAEG